MLEEISHHPRTRKSQEGASIVEAKIILLLNVHTIVTKMMTEEQEEGQEGKEREEGQDDLQEEEEGWFICGHLG